MLAYIGRRILQMIPVFIGVTIILFILRSPGVLGGDPVRMITGEKAISETLYNQIVKKHGLDKPVYEQYWRYLSDLVHGDLGESYQKSRPVTDILLDKFPNTFKLAAAAIIVEIFFGIAAGLISAIKRYSFWDVLVTFSTSVLVAMPVFWLGLLLQFVFGVKFKQWGLPYLPISGMTSQGVPDGGAYDPAGGHSGVGLDGLRGAHHAQPAAGGHGPGLHPHRRREGAFGVAGDHGPRA